jgi:hypothetical protein
VVWLVAAVGMACGAGLPGLALVVTGLYFVALYAFPAVVRRLPKVGLGSATLRLDYEDGRGVLRRVMEICTGERFRVAEVSITSESPDSPAGPVGTDGPGTPERPEGLGAPEGPGKPVPIGGALAGGGTAASGGTATGSGTAMGGGTAVGDGGPAGGGKRPHGTVSVLLALHGRGSVAQLVARLQEVDGVLAVHAGDSYADD